MKTDLTREQIKAYRRDGCLLLPGFLAEEELEELTAAVTKGIEHMGRRRLAGAKEERWLEEVEFRDRVFLQRINLWKLDETVRRYFLNPQLGKMLCRLEGSDGIRVWHDQTLQKRPWANPTGWHVDNPKWSFSSPHALSVWIALDEATVQNGCMYYLPGSHKLISYEDMSLREDIGAYFEQFPQFVEVEPVVAVMKAGDAGVHNGLTAHGAGPNLTPRWRRAMTCAYMPDGATFNGQQNILSDEQFGRLQVGDRLDDEGQNPLVWSESPA